MLLGKVVVIVDAEPVIGTRVIINGFARHVKYWVVKGYSWDGDCLCSAVHFKDVQIPVDTLEISKNTIVQKLKQIT